jgi:hypothetical protein
MLTNGIWILSGTIKFKDLGDTPSKFRDCLCSFVSLLGMHIQICFLDCYSHVENIVCKC